MNNIVLNFKKNLSFIIFSPILILIIYFFYIPLINNWFRGDDLYLMWAAAKLKIYEMFFIPEKHRMLSSNFNPLYGLSLKADWMLFRMNAIGYAIHCIISTLLSSLMLFLFLKLFVNRNLSFLGMIFYLLNPLTINMTGTFFRRHYVEGLIFSLLSLYLFIISEKEDNALNRHKILSSGCYLIASLYREIYVILPAIALLISSKETYLNRFRSTSFYWIVLLIYSIWRLLIREGLGGYPSNRDFLSIENLTIIPNILKSFGTFWTPDYHLIGYIFISIILLSAIRNINFLIIFGILLIPILPVSNIISYNPLTDKYYFHIIVFLIIIIVLLIKHTSFKFKNVTRVLFLLFYFYITYTFIKYDFSFIKHMNYESSISKETAMEYMYSNKPFIEARQPYWFYVGLKNINKDFFNKEIKTEIIPSNEFIKYSNPKRLEEMKASGISLKFREIIREQNNFKDSPISIKIIIDGYKFSWEFGPFKDKIYTLLRSPISGLYYNKSELKHKGVYMLPKENDQISVVFIKILYYTDKGEEVVSPEFEIKFPGKFMVDYKK